MSWLPPEKLTAEEKEVLQEFKRRKDTLLVKYNNQIKDLNTTHETCVINKWQHLRQLVI